MKQENEDKIKKALAKFYKISPRCKHKKLDQCIYHKPKFMDCNVANCPLIGEI